MDQTEKTNVIPMKKEKEQKISRALCYRQMCDTINHSPIGQLSSRVWFPSGTKSDDAQWEYRYHTVDRGDGIRQVMQRFPDDSCKIVDIEVLIYDIIKYTSSVLWIHEEFRWIKRQGKEAAEYWVSKTDPVEMPVPVLEKSKPGLCFYRLPWDFDRDNPCNAPLFEEFVKRIKTNQMQFVQFIGSLFDLNSDRQQYLWLYGEGGNGKGAVMKVLHEVLKSQYASENTNNVNQFWTAGLLGKRLVVFEDCNSP